MRPAGSTLIRDALGRKLCIRCGEWLPESEFYTLQQTADHLNIHCKECMKWGNLLRIFGLSQDEFESRLGLQGGACAICRTPASNWERRLHVDHDRACCPSEKSCGKCVRGILCPRCNAGIGQFQDSPERLRAAADYLEAWV